MTGRRELRRARSSSCGVGDEAIAGVVLRDLGCPEELTSPVLFPVPAGIAEDPGPVDLAVFLAGSDLQVQAAPVGVPAWLGVPDCG
jgi:hypothetical protein